MAAAMCFFSLLLLLAISSRSDAAGWCVCRSDQSDSVLQKTLDYACGAGADCGPILQNGGCFQPNTVKAHCSYAVNSYFQRKGQSQGACDFSGTAVVSTTDPSFSGCSFPSSASTAGTGTTTPMGGTGSTTTQGVLSPPGYGGLGPQSSSDTNDGSLLPVMASTQLLLPAAASLLLPLVYVF